MGFADRFTHYDYKYLLPASSRLPWRLANRVADLRGRVSYRLKEISRRQATENLSEIYPGLKDRKIRSLVIRHFQTQCREEMEAFWYPRPLSFLQQFVTIENLPVLTRAVERGRGVLLCSGHWGSVGLFFAFLGKSGFPMHVVGRSIDPADYPTLHPSEWKFNTRKVRWIEEQVGNPFLLTARGNFPRMIELLGAGETIMLLVDVVPQLLRRTVRVNFLGWPSCFGDGAASLCRATGASLIYWSIARNRASGIHSISFDDLTPPNPEELTNTEIMQALISRLEQKIMAQPDHWFFWDSLELYRSLEGCS